MTKLKLVDTNSVKGLNLDPVDEKTLAQAQEILNSVESEGLKGLLSHSVRLGDLADINQKFLYTNEDLKNSYDALPKHTQLLLQRTKTRIQKFAQAQRNSVQSFTNPIHDTENNVIGTAEQNLSPVAAAGCYCPGGRYPLPSSVLMTAITAKVAQVETVVVASPKPNEITKAAAHVAGADVFIAVGGPQAIAAMAYGIADSDQVIIPKCDVIVGPGNRWVTAAKKLVSGQNCGIDMLAGPSECLVIADDTAHAKVIAADLLAQAEHDPDALPILLSTSRDLIDKVNNELELQLKTLSTASVASVAVSKGFAVFCSSIEEACVVSDRVAPEHLEVMTADNDAVKKRLKNYGGLFVGQNSAEVFGDYGAGPNHVLPTSGTAKYTGGLSVFNFLRIRTVLNIDRKSEELINDAADLARLEGLEGHARAAEARRDI